MDERMEGWELQCATFSVERFDRMARRGGALLNASGRPKAMVKTILIQHWLKGCWNFGLGVFCLLL